MSEEVMAARGTGLRIAGSAVLSLCLSTATPAQQVVYATSTIGCFGVVCVPTAGIAELPALRFTPDFAAFDGPTGSSLLPSLGKNANGRANRDESGDGHFNRATAVYTGVAFGLLVSYLKTSGDGHAPVSDVAPTPPTVPLAAHLEAGVTSNLVATPEPTTNALMATGLIALGLGLARRRRQRSIA
jgi:hypothetical protein